MIKREPLMTEEYFDNDIAFTKAAIEKRVQNLKTDPTQYKKIELVYSTLFTYEYEILISEYSRGYAIDRLKRNFEQIIYYLELYFNHPDHEIFLFEKSLENYELSLWLFSIGVLLKVEEKDIDRLLKCIGNQDKDLLFQQIILKYKKRNEKKNETLIFPKIYSSLYESTLVDLLSAPIFIQSFLKNWYKNMKPCYWFDNHKGKEGGGFFGYWCWEAALVTYLWNLDDTQYREMSYYPKDIVDFAKGE